MEFVINNKNKPSIMKHYIKNFGQFTVNEQGTALAVGAGAAGAKLTKAAITEKWNKLSKEEQKVVKEVLDPFGDLQKYYKKGIDVLNKELKQHADIHAKKIAIAKDIVDPTGLGRKLYSATSSFVKSLIK